MIKYDVFLCCYFFCIGTSFQKIYYNKELNNSCLFQSILKLFRVTIMYHANEYTVDIITVTCDVRKKSLHCITNGR